MNRARMGLTLVALLWMASVAQAAVLVCWNTVPFDDTFRILVEGSPEDDQLFAIPAFHWQGLNVYQMSGTSATRLFESTPTTVRLSVYLDNPTSFFLNHPDCRLRMTLQRKGLNGSWVVDCKGGTGAPFSLSGTATFTPCEEEVEVQSVQRFSAPRLIGQ